MLNLIKALNKASAQIELRDDSIVYLDTKGEGEKKTIEGRYIIKQRPVAGANGVEAFEFVARKNK